MNVLTKTGTSDGHAADARTTALHSEIANLRQLLQVNEARAQVNEARAVAEADRAEDARLLVEETRLVAEDARLRAEDARLVAEDARLEVARVNDSHKEQRRMVHDLIAVGADAVIVLDENYVVTYMNQQAMDEVSGGDSCVGCALLDVYPHIESTPFWPRYKKVMEERVSIAFEDYYEPRKVWYQVNAAPVGKGIAFFFRDVTGRRQRDAALQRTEKLAAVGRLASSISHEINNPLESVTNLLYLIQTSISADDETRTYAQLASS